MPWWAWLLIGIGCVLYAFIGYSIIRIGDVEDDE